MRILLHSGGRSEPATLFGHPTAADLAGLLPVTVELHEVLDQEKAGPLARPLVPGGVAGSTVRPGDIGYWSPNHDIAFYYRGNDHIPSPGIVLVGRLGETDPDRVAAFLEHAHAVGSLTLTAADAQ